MRYSEVLIDHRHFVENTYAKDAAVHYFKGIYRAEGRRPTTTEWEQVAAEFMGEDLSNARADLARIAGVTVDDAMADELRRELVRVFCSKCEDMFEWEDSDLG